MFTVLKETKPFNDCQDVCGVFDGSCPPPVQLNQAYETVVVHHMLLCSSVPLLLGLHSG